MCQIQVMTTSERIKRIADKAKVPYSTIKFLVYSTFGKTGDAIDVFENNLNTLEKRYGIQ